MKRYLITGLLVLSIPMSSIAQGKRVYTPARGAADLLILANKISNSGFPGKESIAETLALLADKVLHGQAVCHTDTECDEFDKKNGIKQPKAK